MKTISYAFLMGSISLFSFTPEAFCGKDLSSFSPEEKYKYYETKRQRYQKQGNEVKALSNFTKAQPYFQDYFKRYGAEFFGQSKNDLITFKKAMEKPNLLVKPDDPQSLKRLARFYEECENPQDYANQIFFLYNQAHQLGDTDATFIVYDLNIKNAGLFNVLSPEMIEYIKAYIKEFEIPDLVRLSLTSRYFKDLLDPDLTTQKEEHQRLVKDIAGEDAALQGILGKKPQQIVRDIHSITSYFHQNDKAAGARILLELELSLIKRFRKGAPFLFKNNDKVEGKWPYSFQVLNPLPLFLKFFEYNYEILKRIFPNHALVVEYKSECGRLSVNTMSIKERIVILKVENNEKGATQLLRLRADLGDSCAQYEIARLYARGHGVKKNDTKAFHYYQKSADRGHEGSLFNLGIMYMKGCGVRQDFKKAFECFERAAARGLPAGYNGLGILYAKGQGVEQDWKKAAHYYKKAGKMGDESALFNLAFCYEHGLGVGTNREKAEFYYQQAQDEGVDIEAGKKQLCEMFFISLAEESKASDNL